MGWNHSKPPDNSKAYQYLSADEAEANQDDLIMWPPLVIIHNTNTGKSRDGKMEGLGNKWMDGKIRGYILMEYSYDTINYIGLVLNIKSGTETLERLSILSRCRCTLVAG
ncbi:hypothetical protein L195_g004536 [Trifolium pratense]|uniref:XS domain-containing protein n=1 Tax=Trifolium pratense TaxID=57577 RepID=A0A2K3NYB2_TRIPR|nr:hypothetical protein L195_g004536 [Trifolium pratense]